MSEPTPGNRTLAAPALCLAIIGAAAMLYYHLHLFIPHALQVRAAQGYGRGYAFGDDFYPIWLVARQTRLEHGDPYSPQMTREIQTGLFGRPLDRSNSNLLADYREFAYPAFTELLLSPTAAVEFPTLRLILAVLLPVLTVASIWMWLRALQWRLPLLWFAVVAVLALCNYAALEAFYAEQPGLIVAFLLASSMLALRRNRLLLAGILLSLTLIKPQMTLLAAFYLVLWSLADRRRVRLAVGFLVTTLLMVSVSLWIWPHWMLEWIRVLLGYHRYATPPLVTLLLGTTAGPYLGRVVIFALLSGGILLAWQNRRAHIDSRDFWLTLSVLLAITSVAILPGQAVYDHLILLPGILLLVRDRRALRSLGRIPATLLALGAIVLGWQWIAALGVIAAHVWLSPVKFEAILTLPIRTAASLPFAVLALLFYATKINRALKQESP